MLLTSSLVQARDVLIILQCTGQQPHSKKLSGLAYPWCSGSGTALGQCLKLFFRAGTAFFHNGGEEEERNTSYCIDRLSSGP